MLLRASIAALALLVSACSSTRFAYDHADFLIRWRATSYLDVHGAQSEQLDSNIAAFLAWHRARALPQYVRLAEEFGTRTARGITHADLVWGYDAVLEQARQSLRAAAGEVADLLDSLSAEQIAHLESRIAEDNRKFAREYLVGTPRERRERRVRRNVERLEDWLGTLTEAQLERVKQYGERVPLLDELRDQDRRRRQAQFLAIVRAREAKQRLADWAAGWDRDRDPAYERDIRAMRDEYMALLLDLDRTMTPAQRRAAVTRFRDLAGDFAHLAAKGAAR